MFRTMRPVTAGALALLPLLAPVRAQEPTAAPVDEDIQVLRREVQELREEIRALKQQMAALSAASPAACPAEPMPSAPPELVAPPPPLSSSVAPTRSQNLMNPAISAVFQAIGNTSLRRKSEENGFDLSEAELAFQSVVDPYAKVDLFLSFPAGETPEVEEGFVSTLALPASLQLKGGRFKNAFGKWNTLHTHAFFTVDRPDALVNFFGEESLATDGLSLSSLIPNPWELYLESTTEVGTALEGVSFNGARRSLTWLERLSAFFSTTPNSTLEVGITASRGKAGPPEELTEAIDSGGLALVPRDKLDSAVDGLDVTFKWKPLHLNVYRSFLWQTEAFRSRRHLDLLTPSLILAPGTVSSLGGYSYVEWQFAKRWRGGIRYDLSGFPDSEAAREVSSSAVIRFQPSEFQELRFQVKNTSRNDAAAARFDGEEDDTRIFFEWIPAIGAHGAHKY